MIRLVDAPHREALRIIGFENEKLSGTTGFPTSKRQLLDKLQVKLAVYNDRIEVNSLFPVESPEIQLCSSTRGKGLRVRG